jgi:Uncharacterized protein conserved in bacteria (DUF2188)
VSVLSPSRALEEGVPKKNVWTVPPDGGWANKLEGSSRFLNRAPTKREAQALGRERAMKDKVEHIIKNRDGQIGQRNSYGHDPTQRPWLARLTPRLHDRMGSAGRRSAPLARSLDYRPDGP